MDAATLTKEAVPTSAKALLFLAGRDADRADLLPALLAFLAARRAPGLESALWEALPADALGASPQGQAGPGSAYDFVLELAAADGHHAFEDALKGLGDVAGLDAPHSVLVAGTEHHIMPGAGDTGLFCPLVRLPHLSGDAFRRYWLDVHAEFGRKDPASRYRQLHPSEAWATRLARAAGLSMASFDGVAEAFFDDLPAMVARLNSPDIAGEAYADEQRFIDHARSSFLPFDRIRS